jgi:uncharacterized protein
MNNKPIGALAVFFAGALFSTGLVLSGMTQPVKVQGFLNIAGLFNPAQFGAWDPTLAFVMGGGLLVSLVAFAIPPRADKKPWFSSQFDLPLQKKLDGRLLVGASLFGIGWALAGYCPGPAIASLGTGENDAILFVIAMLVGMAAARRVLR